MSYFPQVPNESNLVRGVSGDLVRMRTNFATLEPVAGGVRATDEVLHGWLYGEGSRADRFRVDVSGASYALQVNSGGVSSPTWATFFSMTSGGDPAFALPVSGQAPTAAAHLTTRAWVEGFTASGLTLSGLADTSVSGVSSGQALVWNGVAWTFGAAGVTTLAALTDTNTVTAASGSILAYDGAQWVSTASGLTSGQVLQYLGGGVYGGSNVGDHGGLLGLADDDHPQYVPADATRGFTDAVSGRNPTSGFHLATKDYVDNLSGLSISGATTLSGLTDTYDGATTTPEDGQALVYASGVARWVPGAAAGGADVIETQVFS